MPDALKTPVPNKLIDEKSPYLLQHAYNPVECTRKKKRLLNSQKNLKSRSSYPSDILRVIGVMSWNAKCLRMKRLPKNAMNEYFVNVKVDREERPDVDRVDR